MYVCMYICMHACMYVCMYVCMHYACMYACIYVCLYVCTYVCIYVCMYVRRCLCMYMAGARIYSENKNDRNTSLLLFLTDCLPRNVKVLWRKFPVSFCKVIERHVTHWVDNYKPINFFFFGESETSAHSDTLFVTALHITAQVVNW